MTYCKYCGADLSQNKKVSEITWEEQNISLQSELDKEIKNNRKLVKVLKDMAHILYTDDAFAFKVLKECIKQSRQILKEIGEE